MFDINVSSTAAVIFFMIGTIFYLHWYRSHKADMLYAKNNYCLALQTVPYKWPLAVDLLWAVYYHARKGNILQFFNGIIAKLPPTFEQKILGLSGINTFDPRNIEAVLATQFSEFNMGDRARVWYPLIGPGIFTQDGEDWKHSRNMLRPLFLQKCRDNFIEVKGSVTELLEAIPEKKFIDFQQLFFRFTLDTTTYLLFGHSIRSLANENKEAEAFGKSFRMSQEYLSHRGRLGPFYWLVNPKKFRDANATVHKWIDRKIEEALAVRSSKKKGATPWKEADYGFLGSLMAETQDLKVLRDALLNVLLAGRDTTACMLTWTMRLLLKHDNVMARLREEVESVLGVGEEARMPDRNDIKKMLYLTYVLKEVLRLYPSVPINSRASVKDTTLPTGGGPHGTAPVYIRKGSPVGYAVFAMHRRNDLYGSDAEKFRPERWDPNVSNEVDLKNIGWGYLPFNGGPRVCIGQEFAILEASCAVVRLLQTFSHFECDPTKQMSDVWQERQDLSLVLASGDGCWIGGIK